jgi:hypothetical protein
VGSAVPRLVALVALIAALSVAGCRDPIESAPGFAQREARQLPLPESLAGLAHATVLTRTAEAQPPPARSAPRADDVRAAATRLGIGDPPAAPTTTAGYSQTPEEMRRELESGEPLFLMPLGAGSTVLRVRFAGDLAAVFRPQTRGQSEGPFAEVAVYRIAVALGLDDVPPAVLRRMDVEEMRRRFSGDAADWDALRRSLLIDPDGTVQGAAIAYETALRGLGLEQPRKRAEWEAWLVHGGEVPETSRSLARDLSRMRVLDYLVGNRERFDSALRGLRDESRVLLRNHDTAFQAPLPDGIERRLRAELLATEKFSRSMVAGLAALDRPALEALLVAEGGPLLDAARLDGVLDRRDTILSYVEALCDRFGTSEVFFFE